MEWSLFTNGTRNFILKNEAIMETSKLKGLDLRIGNLVKYCNGVYRIIEVSPIHLLVQNANDINDIQHRAIQNAEPIELTEEVLLKIGFEKIEFVKNEQHKYYKKICIDNYIYMLDFMVVSKDISLSITRYDKEDEGNVVDYYYEVFLSDEIKNLHQLQNAYYCLTGKELEVEL